MSSETEPLELGQLISSLDLVANRTKPAGKHRLIVNVTLDPSHKVLNVIWGWHLSRPLEALCILP